MSNKPEKREWLFGTAASTEGFTGRKLAANSCRETFQRLLETTRSFSALISTSSRGSTTGSTFGGAHREVQRAQMA